MVGTRFAGGSVKGCSGRLQTIRVLGLRFRVSELRVTGLGSLGSPGLVLRVSGWGLTFTR